MTNAYSIDVLLPSIIVIIVAQINHFERYRDGGSGRDDVRERESV